MPVEVFMIIHAMDMAACPDAEIAVYQPAFEAPPAMQDAVKGLVTGVSGVLGGLMTKNPNAGRIAGAVAGNVVGGYVTRHLDRPEQVVIIRVRDLMGTD